MFGWQLEVVHGRYRAGVALVLAVLALSAGRYLLLKLLRRRRHGAAAIRRAALARVAGVSGAARSQEPPPGDSSSMTLTRTPEVAVGSRPEDAAAPR